MTTFAPTPIDGDYLERVGGTVAELTRLHRERNPQGLTDVWAGLHPRDQAAVVAALVSVAARCETEHVPPVLPAERMQ